MLAIVAFFTETTEYNSLFQFTGYFFLTLFAIRAFKEELSESSIVGIVFGTMFLMQAYTIYLLFVESIFSLPFILLYCLGIGSAFLYNRLKRPTNLLPLTFSYLLVGFMFFQGWDYWRYISH